MLRVVAVAVVLVAMMACTRESSPSASSVTLVPWRVLDDSLFGYNLSSTSVTRLLPDSGLLVSLPRGPHVLVHVAPDGRTIAPRVRDGKGPNELATVHSVVAAHESGFWVVSTADARALWVNPHGGPPDSARRLALPAFGFPVIAPIACDSGLAMVVMDGKYGSRELHFVLMHARSSRPTRRLRHVATMPMRSDGRLGRVGGAHTSWRNGRAFELETTRLQIASLHPACGSTDTLPLRSAWLPTDTVSQRSTGRGVGLIEWVDDTTLAVLGSQRKHNAAATRPPPVANKDGNVDMSALPRFFEANYDSVIELFDARTFSSRGVLVLKGIHYSFAGHGMLAQIADTDNGRELRLSRIVPR
jgi:hypothetical protein